NIKAIVQQPGPVVRIFVEKDIIRLDLQSLCPNFTMMLYRDIIVGDMVIFLTTSGDMIIYDTFHKQVVFNGRVNTVEGAKWTLVGCFFSFHPCLTFERNFCRRIGFCLNRQEGLEISTL
ncbi:hypothetical protein M1146_05410, partial [Patescibacteria group bacterium]|nr:hypothetical protein [Patescibacteria group bacterium]